MSFRTSCMRPPVMMSPPKADNLPAGSTPGLQPVPAVGEPEIKSINFQESLRFFQEQFMKSSSAASGAKYLPPLKIRLRPSLTKTDDSKTESEKATTELRDETTVNITSSEIPPIPTVETILESVRILRAIQRSQAQGGVIWNLECDDASLNCDISDLDSILALDGSLNANGDPDFAVNLCQRDGFPSLDSNTNNSSNDANDALSGSDKTPYLIPSLNTAELESKVNNLCAFWPRAVVDMVKQNVDLNNLLLSTEKCNDLNATSLSKNVTQEMCNNVNVALREYLNISLPPNLNVGEVVPTSTAHESLQEHISSLPDEERSPPLNCEDQCNNSVSPCYVADETKAGEIADDLTDEYMSCSSLISQEDQLNGNIRDRSPSVLDSGIATDKSLESCSPTSALSHFTDTEGSSGSSWTEGSHYDSAEGSPFASFSDVAVAQSLAVDAANGSKQGSKSSGRVRQESPAGGFSCDDQVSGICEGGTDDTDVDFDTCNSSLCETDNAASPELSERDLLLCSPYQQDGRISPKLSSDIHGDRSLETEDSCKSTDDVQKDRLLEVVEDTIHRVEFIPVPIHRVKCIPVQEEATSLEQAPVDNDQQCQDVEPQNVEVIISEPSEVTVVNGVHDNTDYISEVSDDSEVKDLNSSSSECSTVIREFECDLSSDKELPATLCETANAETDNEFQGENGTVKEFYADGVLSKSDDVIVENSICVSKMECSLIKAGDAVVDTEDKSESLRDERPKKAPTLSWDPIQLLQNLYKLDQKLVYPSAPSSDEKHSGMLKVLPLGTFSEKGGLYYVVLDKNYCYFYESSECEEFSLCIPLQYSKVQVYDKHTALLDNRQGRCIHMKFESEKERDGWLNTLEPHCMPQLSSKYVEPVHYPLKCHKDVIIVDLGSCSTRAGILMDQPTLPSVYFPTVCATDKKTKNRVYGLEALLPEVRQNSILSFPARTSAKVTKFTMDIDALKGLFQKIFCELGVDPAPYTLEICIPRALSIQTQAALVKMLLEDLRVKAVSLTRQALLTLYAHNTSTGIVVDIGDRMDILPVVDGFILETGVSRLPYGGQRIIHHMKHALAEKHVSLSNEVESYLVQYIMENLCYIAGDFEKEQQYAASCPEGLKKSIPIHPFFQGDNVLLNVTLDSGRFQVAEGLFNPDLWGLDSPGLHKLVHQAIQSSGVDVRRHITESIYVSGGVTLLPGFVERLEAEISKLTLPRLKPQIHASPYRNHMAYLGACQLAASAAFPQVCVTAEEWEQLGPRCLKKWHL